MEITLSDDILNEILTELNKYAVGSFLYNKAAGRLIPIVQQILSERLNTTFFYDNIPEGPEDTVTGESPLAVRTLLAFMATSPAQGELYRGALCTMLAELSALSGRYSASLLKPMLEVFGSDGSAPIRFRLDMAAETDTDEIACKVLTAMLNWKTKGQLRPTEHYGVMRIVDGRICLGEQISDLHPEKYCLKAYEKKLLICAHDAVDLGDNHTLKQADRLTKLLASRMRSSGTSSDRRWKKGEITDATVIDAGDGYMHLRTLPADEKLPMEGPLDFYDDENIFSMIPFAQLREALPTGTNIQVIVADDDPGRFDLFGPLRSFSNEEALLLRGKGIPACAVDEIDGLICWTDQEGHMILSEMPQGGVEAGTFRNIMIVGLEGEHTWAQVLDGEAEKFDLAEAYRGLLGRFVYLPSNETACPDYVAVCVKELVRALLADQQRKDSDGERHTIMCICQLLCEFIGQHRDAEYIQLLRDYLRTLSEFRRGEAIAALAPSMDLPAAYQIRQRCNVVYLLSALLEHNGPMAQRIFDTTDSEFVKKIARLTLSYIYVGDARSENKSVAEVRENIRSIIIGQLVAENNAELIADKKGFWYGEESEYKEFKTSFVFRPKDCPAYYPATQMEAIAQGVCAFMNTPHGGTLYLGVNDSGYISGVQCDYNTLACRTMDEYMNKVRMKLRQLLKDKSMYFTLEPEQNDRVLAIRIRPCEYGVATVADKAYIRNSNGKNLMTEEEVNVLLSSRLNIDRHQLDCYLQLYQAKQAHKQAVLVGYRSGSSPICDRLVEPFEFSFHQSSVWCYEIERDGIQTGQVKQFRIARTQSVRLLDKPWEHSSEHLPMKVDIFRMSGDKEFPVQLLLTQRAYNLLVEEYPAAKEEKLVKPWLGDDKYSWLLDAIVCSELAVGRFVAGLMNDVKILDGEPLKEYLRLYLAEAIKKMD